MNKTEYKDLGSIDYKEAWDFQEKLFNTIIEAKKKDVKQNDFLLFCEHPHVYTLGKSGDKENMLLNYIQLQAKNASFYEINRGGDITYHGPGQLVGYPILDLAKYKMGIKNYIHNLEEAIILCLKDYGLQASRLEGATGVWLDIDKPGRIRKICAIGVRVSRWVSMHGFALNVNTDMKYFDYINPCGFVDKGVTSLEKELNRPIDIQEVKDRLKNHIVKLFGMNI